MKALFLHCKNYRIAVGKLANRPANIHPEPVTETTQEQDNCVVVLITVEKGDGVESTSGIISEITKMAHDVGHNNIVVFPFAHLSNNLAESEISISILENIKEKLSDEFNVKRGHFGSHKEFMLDVFGHPGNARFREY
ncbi:MAG: threonyl-tRNA synthetase editing domain-containing protein [Candidatus Saccharimonadales bacterium]